MRVTPDYAPYGHKPLTVRVEKYPQGWMVVTQYPDGVQDRLPASSLREALDYAYLLKEIVKLTKDVELIQMLAAESVDFTTAVQILQVLKAAQNIRL